ncbi:MAG TPA: DNA mismatch repair protein [Niastella sp.]
MSFITDPQTLEDLNILGKHKAHSFFSMFNQVLSAGGERLLHDMFRQPLCDAKGITERTVLFRYFQEKDLPFPLDPKILGAAENYLTAFPGTSYVASAIGLIYKRALGNIFRNPQFEQIRTGLYATIDMLHAVEEFVGQIEDSSLREQVLRVRTVWNRDTMRWMQSYRQKGKLTFGEMVEAHHDLLYVYKNEMGELLQLMYLVDVCIAVAGVAKQKSLGFAEVLTADAAASPQLYTGRLWHPAIPAAVPNSMHFNPAKNMIFLTGANMAGKSTLMKALGAAVYLAHMGFPVAAEEMRFTVMDGLFTSINVPDNLNKGYSHFYAEVLRVKTVAAQVSEGRRLLVIFDELFKGTNVKDAFDATLAVSEAFAAYRNCFYIISTHIIEVGAELGTRGDHILFRYMPTRIEAGILSYTFSMAEGISNDRQGMMIIEKEGIPAMLQAIVNENAS